MHFIMKIKRGKSKDVYGITSDMVIKVAQCIVVPLQMCINDCLASGHFPVCLKSSKIVPVYKKG